ncbi:Homoserine dehydrogenase [Marinomonas mediterranea MMB-1]|jgi:homoserine dehydrogenase (EC 1.1.1.3)|uniref:Homoserine dehydrogenase n=2 Tax=Marinomonas mediterranea TaxID=119864 RepID=F2JZ92_MARM1|nr:Homoserine dehydrogenase [Marinomonas mediterranea MMB-1]
MLGDFGQYHHYFGHFSQYTLTFFLCDTNENKTTIAWGNAMKNYNIALIGFGGVNRALAEIIHNNSGKMEQELGFSLKVVAVSDMYLGSLYQPEGIELEALTQLPVEKGALAALPNGKEDADNENIIKNSNADIVAEATFTDAVTGEPAISHCQWALSSGKHICTTNKGPLALSAGPLKTLAAQNQLGFEYEGVVMSGTPVLRYADQMLKGATTNRFEGIVNGTANFVLGLVEQGQSFEQAIKQAQELGYAEADPTADIGGKDVMLKVIVLANSLFGVHLATQDVACVGIDTLTETDIIQAQQDGFHWKLIGKASLLENGQVEAQVAPEKLPSDHPLAGAQGATNAVTFYTDMLGPVTVSGPGAGRIETGYALLSDIIAIHTKTHH